MIAVLLVVFGAKQILINTLGTAFFFQLHLTIIIMFGVISSGMVAVMSQNIGREDLGLHIRQDS